MQCSHVVCFGALWLRWRNQGNDSARLWWLVTANQERWRNNWRSFVALGHSRVMPYGNLIVVTSWRGSCVEVFDLMSKHRSRSDATGELVLEWVFFRERSCVFLVFLAPLIMMERRLYSCTIRFRLASYSLTIDVRQQNNRQTHRRSRPCSSYACHNVFPQHSNTMKVSGTPQPCVFTSFSL